MKLKRHIGQQVALATAAFCALLTLPAFAVFLWLWKERGLADTWTPSALASVAFLGACTVVLYVMSRPQPPLPQDGAAAVDR
jgi:hypothetical protein